MNEGTLGQARRVLEIIDQKKVPEDRLQKLLGSGLFADLLEAEPLMVDRDAFRNLLSLGPAEAVYRTYVNYKLRLEKAIKAGRYNDVFSEYRSPRTNFFDYSEFGEPREIDIKLMAYDHPMSTIAARDDLHLKGFRLVVLPELLALGATYKALQWNRAIVGDICCREPWDPCKCVPYLASGPAEEKKRYLGMMFKDNEWPAGTTFPYVVK
jgi:hypothetical protein